MWESGELGSGSGRASTLRVNWSWCEPSTRTSPRHLFGVLIGVQPRVHAPHRVPHEYIGSLNAGIMKEGAEVSDHIAARARIRCRVALSPSGTIEPADPGEPGYLLLNRRPVLAWGTQPRLQDHRRAAFTNALNSQPVSAHVHQGVLAITRRGAICAHSPSCLQLPTCWSPPGWRRS